MKPRTPFWKSLLNVYSYVHKEYSRPYFYTFLGATALIVFSIGTIVGSASISLPAIGLMAFFGFLMYPGIRHAIEAYKDDPWVFCDPDEKRQAHDSAVVKRYHRMKKNRKAVDRGLMAANAKLSELSEIRGY